MGYRTVVVLNNDLAHSWQNDPELGAKIRNASFVADKSFSYGDVVECVHADTQTLIVADGYQARGVAYSHWAQGDTKAQVEMKLMRELAAKHGYSLRKKPQRDRQ